MRLRTAFMVAAALACAAARAAADPLAAAASPSPEGVAPASGPGDARPPAAPAASPAASEWHRAWLGTVGVGYYEQVHVGVGLELGPASSLGVFGGTDFGIGTDRTFGLGLSYAHGLRRIAGRFEAGLDAKAMYWAQSSPDYDWKMMSLVLGAFVARELVPGISLALDGGVALSFSVGSERKQNVSFEYPTRWNGSVCLELRYRFDRW